MTFGFQSAVDIATNAIDCIHTTAASHNRVFIVEVMGHKVGWLTLHAGIAGGADIILIPEIPYDIDKVIEAITKRTKAGKGFTILAVAEGAITKGGCKALQKGAEGEAENRTYPSVSYELADQIFQKRPGLRCASLSRGTHRGAAAHVRMTGYSPPAWGSGGAADSQKMNMGIWWVW